MEPPGDPTRPGGIRLSPVTRALLAATVLGLLVAPTASADLLSTTLSTTTTVVSATTSTVTSSTSGEVLVGFAGPINLQLLQNNGATVRRTMDAIRVAQVYTSDVAGLSSRLNSNSNVTFVETNDPIRLSASSWDASSWDASSWDASSWDASSWDASSWDASSWDASSWDASSWDASSWDASSWDASSWDASSWDASSWDASSWDSATMDPGFTSQWGLGAAHFPLAWEIERGNGRVGICVLDTGVDASHPDLRPHLLTFNGSYGVNAMMGGGSPADDVGHGTHVAGIIAAVQGNGTGVVGAANEPVLSVKVMDASGGKEADLARGLNVCANSGARVATMSLHLTSASKTVQRAIEYAQSKGVLLVASAGNSGADTVTYPAAYPGVLAVGAATPAGQRATFSNHGARVDLWAPGDHIVSTFPGGYASASGTSQAAPFVAAAAALVWERAPTASAATVRSTLLATANPIAAGPALDAAAAVAAAG